MRRSNMRKYTFLCLLFALLTQCALGKDLKGEFMQIQMQFQGKRFVLTLENNAAARDFYALLPLSLSFSDYVGKEKIARLDKSLSTQESGEYDPQIGDFFYFAPWGNVGIFYRTPQSPKARLYPHNRKISQQGAKIT